MTETSIDRVRESGGEPSRRRFLRRSAGMGAAAGAAAVLATPEQAAAQLGQSVSGILRTFREIQGHENDHVAFLVDALGPNAYAQPQFVGLEMRRFRDFATQSLIFENTGVGTYLGAAPLINDPDTLADAAAIALIEGEHSGYLNTLLGVSITLGQSFTPPLPATLVAQRVSPFFADPSLPVTLANAISTTRSDANDIAILRFALGLEYLEAVFYNLNVPRFAR